MKVRVVLLGVLLLAWGSNGTAATMERLFVVPRQGPNAVQLESTAVSGIQVDGKNNVYLNVWRQEILQYSEKGELLRRMALDRYWGGAFTVATDGTIVLSMVEEVTGTIREGDKKIRTAKYWPDRLAWRGPKDVGWRVVAVPERWGADHPLRIASGQVGDYFGEEVLNVPALALPDVPRMPAPLAARVQRLPPAPGKNTERLRFSVGQVTREIDDPAPKGYFLYGIRGLAQAGNRSYFLVWLAKQAELDIGKAAVRDYWQVLIVDDKGNVRADIPGDLTPYSHDCRQPFAVTASGDVLQVVTHKEDIQVLIWRNPK